MGTPPTRGGGHCFALWRDHDDRGVMDPIKPRSHRIRSSPGGLSLDTPGRAPPVAVGPWPPLGASCSTPRAPASPPCGQHPEPVSSPRGPEVLSKAGTGTQTGRVSRQRNLARQLPAFRVRWQPAHAGWGRLATAVPGSRPSRGSASLSSLGKQGPLPLQGCGDAKRDLPPHRKLSSLAGARGHQGALSLSSSRDVRVLKWVRGAPRHAGQSSRGHPGHLFHPGGGGGGPGRALAPGCGAGARWEEPPRPAPRVTCAW